MARSNLIRKIRGVDNTKTGTPRPVPAEPVIRTEGEYTAAFQPTDKLVDEAFFRVSDSLATTNAVLYVSAAVLAILTGFVVFFCVNRGEMTESVLLQVTGLPLTLLGFCMLVAAVLIFIRARSTSGSLMTQLVPFFGVLVLASVLVCQVSLDSSKFDPLVLKEFSTAMTPTNASYVLAFATSLLAVFVSWVNGGLRVDKLNFLAAPFMSFFIAVAAASFLIFQILASVLGTVQGTSLEPGAERNALFLMIAFALFFLVMIGDYISVKTADFFSDQKTVIAASPETANADFRTKQALLFCVALLFFIPASVVMGLKDRISPGDGPNWGVVAPALLLATPVFFFPAIVAVQIRYSNPAIYYVLSNLMIAAVFFVVGTLLIEWTKLSALAVGGAVLLMTMFNFLNATPPSNLVVIASASGLFILLKYLGRDWIEPDASPQLRAAVKALPLLLVVAIWLLRSYALQSDYSMGILLAGFAATYLLLDEPEDGPEDGPGLGETPLERAGLDFVLATTILLTVGAGALIVPNQVVGQVGAIDDRALAPWQSTVRSLLMLGLGAAGAKAYVDLPGNADYRRIVRDNQKQAAELANCLGDDIEIMQPGFA